MGSPVVHFEIHAQEPERALAFYRGVFGWADNTVPGMEQQYWLLYPDGQVRESRDEELPGIGIAGGMLVRQGPPPDEGAPVNGFVCVIQVDDLDAVHGAVPEHGGSIALPPFDVEGVGRVFYAKDTEGNIFGVIQPEDA